MHCVRHVSRDMLYTSVGDVAGLVESFRDVIGFEVNNVLSNEDDVIYVVIGRLSVRHREILDGGVDYSMFSDYRQSTLFYQSYRHVYSGFNCGHLSKSDGIRNVLSIVEVCGDIQRPFLLQNQRAGDVVGDRYHMCCCLC